MRKQRIEKPKNPGISMTKPGQSLVPAELLKRHLAGTLPDIAKVPNYTYDEHGQQISEDLSHLELHELADLALQLRTEYKKREKELAEKNKAEYDEKVIDAFKSKQPVAKEPPVGTAPASGKRDGAAGGTLNEPHDASSGVPK